MTIELVRISGALLGLMAGAIIGWTFGLIQDAAARKYLRLQNAGKLSNGWTLIPGSMRRTAYLLIALAAVQVICPLLFRDGTQWWVSVGVVAGYGWSLWRKLRESLAARGQ